MVNRVESFGKVKVNNIRLNVLVKTLTNRVKNLYKLSDARTISKKTVL